jgi:hypothetical protein
VLGNAIRRIAQATRRGNTVSDANVSAAANVGERGSARTSVRAQTTRIVQRDGATPKETHDERGT